MLSKWERRLLQLTVIMAAHSMGQTWGLLHLGVAGIVIAAMAQDRLTSFYEAQRASAVSEGSAWCHFGPYLPTG